MTMIQFYPSEQSQLEPAESLADGASMQSICRPTNSIMHMVGGWTGEYDVVARVRETLRQPPLVLTLEQLREAEGDSV